MQNNAYCNYITKINYKNWSTYKNNRKKFTSAYNTPNTRNNGIPDKYQNKKTKITIVETKPQLLAGVSSTGPSRSQAKIRFDNADIQD